MASRSYFGKMNSTLGSVVPLAIFFFTSLETFFVVVFILYPITIFPMIITSYSYEIFLALHEFLKYFLQQGNLKNSALQLANVDI